VTDLESEVAKLQKIKAELVIEKDQVLRERLDLKINEEKQKQEARQFKELNDDLLKQVEDMKRKLQALDPELMKEQK
jgi:chromosome segregation ATPase